MQILEKVHDRAVLPLNEAFAKLTARELGQDLLERGDDLVHVGTLGWVVLVGGPECPPQIGTTTARVRTFKRSGE